MCEYRPVETRAEKELAEMKASRKELSPPGSALRVFSYEMPKRIKKAISDAFRNKEIKL